MAPDSESESARPDVKIDADASRFLVPESLELRKGLLGLIDRQAAEANLRVNTIRLSVKKDYEEDWDELLFTVFVDTGEDEAMALWESIGDAIMKWRSGISSDPQRILDEQIAVFVEWP